MPHKNLHHRLENLHPKKYAKRGINHLRLSLQGEDLHLLSGSLRKLLNIRNSIHRKHWNPDLALSLHPKHYLNKTFSRFGWLRFVAILNTFFKIRTEHKCSNQTSNLENLCFKAHASSKSGKLMPKPLLWEKSFLSEVVVPYKG